MGGFDGCVGGLFCTVILLFYVHSEGLFQRDVFQRNISKEYFNDISKEYFLLTECFQKIVLLYIPVGNVFENMFGKHS